MNLPLAATADVAVGFSFPVWMLWGVSFAVVLTIGMFLAVLLFGRGDEDIFGFETESSFRALATFFVVYGLIPGMFGSLLAFYSSWIWGSILIAVLLFIVVVAHHVLDKTFKKEQELKVPGYVPDSERR